MRQGLLRGALVGLLLAPVAGCVLPPEPGASNPPEGQVVAADARALAYGRSAGEILANPELRDKIRALFGADWAPPTGVGGGKLSAAAPQESERGGPVRIVEVAEARHLTLTG